MLEHAVGHDVNVPAVGVRGEHLDALDAPGRHREGLAAVLAEEDLPVIIQPQDAGLHENRLAAAARRGPGPQGGLLTGRRQAFLTQDFRSLLAGNALAEGHGQLSGELGGAGALAGGLQGPAQEPRRALPEREQSAERQLGRSRKIRLGRAEDCDISIMRPSAGFGSRLAGGLGRPHAREVVLGQDLGDGLCDGRVLDDGGGVVGLGEDVGDAVLREALDVLHDVDERARRDGQRQDVRIGLAQVVGDRHQLLDERRVHLVEEDAQERRLFLRGQVLHVQRHPEPRRQLAARRLALVRGLHRVHRADDPALGLVVLDHPAVRQAVLAVLQDVVQDRDAFQRLVHLVEQEHPAFLHPPEHGGGGEAGAALAFLAERLARDEVLVARVLVHRDHPELVAGELGDHLGDVSLAAARLADVEDVLVEGEGLQGVVDDLLVGRKIDGFPIFLRNPKLCCFGWSGAQAEAAQKPDPDSFI